MQCEECNKWRRIGAEAAATLPDIWTCSMNGLSCSDPQEPEDEEPEEETETDSESVGSYDTSSDEEDEEEDESDAEMDDFIVGDDDEQ